VPLAAFHPQRDCISITLDLGLWLRPGLGIFSARLRVTDSLCLNVYPEGIRGFIVYTPHPELAFPFPVRVSCTGGLWDFVLRLLPPLCKFQYATDIVLSLWWPIRLPPACCSSVRRLPASPPSVCDVTGSVSAAVSDPNVVVSYSNVH